MGDILANMVGDDLWEKLAILVVTSNLVKQLNVENFSLFV